MTYAARKTTPNLTRSNCKPFPEEKKPNKEKEKEKRKASARENKENKEKIKKEENKSGEKEKPEEEEEDQIEVDPEIIKKWHHIQRYEEDSDIFIDPDKRTLDENLPLYLVDILRNEIKWKRPKKYIMHHFLWEKVKLSFPKKKMSVICEEIIETYKDYLRKIMNGEILNYD